MRPASSVRHLSGLMSGDPRALAILGSVVVVLAIVMLVEAAPTLALLAILIGIVILLPNTKGGGNP